MHKPTRTPTVSPVLSLLKSSSLITNVPFRGISGQSKPDMILELKETSDSDLEAIVSQENRTLVDFYADWVYSLFNHISYNGIYSVHLVEC